MNKYLRGIPDTEQVINLSKCLIENPDVYHSYKMSFRANAQAFAWNPRHGANTNPYYRFVRCKTL